MKSRQDALVILILLKTSAFNSVAKLIIGWK
jgi:hypothetical protein